ncbi:uncharacterized protein [Amphiura filiformis]|uniref:uncharacterized protein n=1 Tax=Amphiura filiformis TaxID=82378 RepID=UPI003B21B62A
MPTRDESDDSTRTQFEIVDQVLNDCGRVMCQFQAQWMYVVTWVNVGYYGSSAGGSIVNSFQVILATDGTQSAGIFYFEDLNWSGGVTNGASASNGLGGIGAQVGFNQGDGVRFFYLPGSRVSNEVINLDTLSNIGVPKTFAYRIDQDEIVALEVQKLTDTYGNLVADGHLCFDDNTIENTPNAQVICEAQGCSANLPITWRINGVPAPVPATDVIDSSTFSTTSTLDLVFASAYDGLTLTCHADEGSMCEETISVTVQDSSTAFLMTDTGGIPVTNSRDVIPQIMVTAGDTVQFICVFDTADCGPYQTVTWDVDGAPLTDTENPGVLGGVSGVISLMQSLEISQGGLITCQFPDGSVKRSVQLNIEGEWD